MKNYVQDGERILVANSSGATITSGSGVLIGIKLGVACAAIADGASGAAALEGVFTIPKLSTDVVAQGAALYWDDTNKRLTTTASGNTYAGFAHAAAGNGVATVNIVLNI